MPILIFISALTLVISSGILSGWCLSLLWLWFLVPFGLPELSIAHAVGISCVIAICVPWPEYADEDDIYVRFGRSIARLIGKPLFVLAVGWIAKSFM